MTPEARAADGSTPPAYFDAMHAGADPWGFETRWYEARKRALVLAALPRPRFERAWEIGCSTGRLSVELRGRCDRLLATDLSAPALDRARRRLEAAGTAPAAATADEAVPAPGPARPGVVEWRQARHPQDWPDGRFDLIVLSEVGYFLADGPLARLVERLPGTLADDGVLLAVHWRHAFADAPLDGERVHAALRARLGAPRLAWLDDDVRLEGWHAGGSPAQREGLRA